MGARTRHWAIGAACGLAMATIGQDSHAEAGYGSGGAAIVLGGVLLLGPVPVLDVIALGLDVSTLSRGRPLSRAWAITELLLGVTQAIPGGVLVYVWAHDATTISGYDSGSGAPLLAIGVPLAALGFWFTGHSIWSLTQPTPAPLSKTALGFATRTPTWNTGLDRTPPPSSPLVLPLYSGSF